MKKIHKYVGLDVHKDTTMIAVAEGARRGEVRLYGQVSSDLDALERAVRVRTGGCRVGEPKLNCRHGFRKTADP